VPVDPYKAPDAEPEDPYLDALYDTDDLIVPSHGKRWFAAFIDNMLIFVPAIALIGVFFGVLFAVADVDPEGPLASGFTLFLQMGAVGVQVVYGAVFESSGWQATPGKKLMGLMVTSQGGDRLSFGAALGRNLAKSIGLSMCGLLALSVLFDDQARGVWDRVATTRVVARNPYA